MIFQDLLRQEVFRSSHLFARYSGSKVPYFLHLKRVLSNANQFSHIHSGTMVVLYPLDHIMVMIT